MKIRLLWNGLDKRVTGRPAKIRDILDRAWIGRDQGKNLTGRHVFQRFARFQHRQRASQTPRIYDLVGHSVSLLQVRILCGITGFECRQVSYYSLAEIDKGKTILMTDRSMEWRIYLSGEIHTNWREEIADGVAAASLPVRLDAPVTDHAASDDCGVAILGAEPDKVWHDHKGAKLNAIRTRTLIEKADIVVVRFGDKYKQWNAAFDAGIAAALGKPLIVIHQDDHAHALKEIDGAALAVCKTSAQVVDILRYAVKGQLPV